MIVSELKLYNFRKFKSNDNEPGLSITFHKGLNALIGENDSGKTAVIDAIKLVLLTRVMSIYGQQMKISSLIATVNQLQSLG